MPMISATPMPKVEAPAHRHRLKNPQGTALPRPRFATLQADTHTYEFDHHQQSLRVSWSGGQTFLPSKDARQLHRFLNHIYTPPERQQRPFPSARLSRRHKAEGKAVSPPQPVEAATQTQKVAGLEFAEYNGWPNRPTWDVFTVLTSYNETREMLERMASHEPGGWGNVRRAVIGSIDQWRKNKPSPHTEAASTLVQDFLMHGVRQVAWTPLFDALRGEREGLGDADPLTTLTYDLLSQTDWKSIVKGAPTLTDADTMLQEWVEQQCMTWLASPDARTYTGSVSVFTETIVDFYLQAVQWEKVTTALRGK